MWKCYKDAIGGVELTTKLSTYGIQPRWEASFYWTHVSIDEYKLLDAFSSFLIHSHQSWEYFSSSVFCGMLRFHSDQVSDGWWPIKSCAVQHLLHLQTTYSTYFIEVRRASNGMNCYITGVQCFTSDTWPFYSLSFFSADNHRCHAPHRITTHKVVHNKSVYRKRAVVWVWKYRPIELKE